MTVPIKKITDGKTLTRNSFLNLFGLAVPMLAAFITIPFLIRNLGTDRFGVLNLVWLIVGYFSLFDMGIGRAITKFVSERLGKVLLRKSRLLSLMGCC
jgi:O-antigen/teichoic acid export membrane protein